MLPLAIIAAQMAAQNAQKAEQARQSLVADTIQSANAGAPVAPTPDSIKNREALLASNDKPTQDTQIPMNLPQPQTTLTPQYRQANKQDLQKNMPYDSSMDYNARIKQWLGL